MDKHDRPTMFVQTSCFIQQTMCPLIFLFYFCITIKESFHIMFLFLKMTRFYSLNFERIVFKFLILL